MDEKITPPEKRARLKETLKRLDDILAKNSYHAKNNPTVADISTLSTFLTLQSSFRNYGEIPNVNAWLERWQALQGFKENLTGKILRFFSLEKLKLKGKCAIEALIKTKGTLSISMN